MKVSVVIPCFNEEAAIRSVVEEFKKILPKAEVYVFDNNSSDATIDEALAAGAKVHTVKQRGKGNVVRAMFRDIESDIYIMVDGDGTYPAKFSLDMIDAIDKAKADVVIGNRMTSYKSSKSRSGHFVGNRILTGTVNYLFDSDIQDLLSGYRVFSRRFVKSIPLFAKGFEVETAMSIHAIEVDAKIVEVPIDYGQRAEGTESKLNTLRDGMKIGWTVFKLFKDQRPKMVYGYVALALFISSLALGIPVVLEFFETGLVERFPTAILSSGLMVISFMFGFTGLILSSISKSRSELKKLSFISMR